MTRVQRNGEGQLSSLALAACVLFILSCGGAEQPGRDISLAPHTESVVPLSDDIAILLFDENTVCTSESYEYRVYCTNENSSEGTFLRKEAQCFLCAAGNSCSSPRAMTRRVR